jgi:hypothetical protein
LDCEDFSGNRINGHGLGIFQNLSSTHAPQYHTSFRHLLYYRLGHPDLHAQRQMNTKEPRLKTILKFDTGADGFQKMIYVLAAGSVIVLIVGLYFLKVVTTEMRNMP